MAEINGLLNRRTVIKPYRGFESPPLRTTSHSRGFFMLYYVYIIQSDFDASYYKGHSDNYLRRISDHNSALSKYTSRKLPWKLVYIEVFASRGEAITRERSLKKYSNEQIRKLIESPNNKWKHLVDEWLKSIPTSGGD